MNMIICTYIVCMGYSVCTNSIACSMFYVQYCYRCSPCQTCEILPVHISHLLDPNLHR